MCSAISMIFNFLMCVIMCFQDEQPKKMSWRSKAWGVLVHIISGYHPTTFSYQKSLPFLPVPQLEETVDRFINSVEPLYDPKGEDFPKLKTQAEVKIDFATATVSQIYSSQFRKLRSICLSIAPVTIGPKYLLQLHAVLSL